MTDDPRDDESQAPSTDESELERTRKLILERRNRFMAAALAGLGMTGGAAACTRASVCLSLAPQEAGSGGRGAAGAKGGAGGGGPGPDPNACPGQPWRQPPCVCLTAPMAGNVSWPYPTAGTTAVAGFGGTGAGGAAGTRPSVCLEPPVEECPRGGPPPCVCLSMPIDEDAGVEGE